MSNIKTATCDVIGITDHWAATQDLDATGTVQSSTRIAINNASLAAFSAKNIPSVDRHKYFGSYANEAALGYTDDGSHFNATGYAFEGGSLGPILAAIEKARLAS